MSVSLAFLAYLVAFGTAAVVCFASVGRARLVDDPDTRRGMVGLLLTSGGWAAAHVGFLVVPSAGLKTAFYVAGLVVGFAAVGPWLYFCSAYTGRSLHRIPAVRRAAVAVFAVVVLVKLTNPLHGRYFTAELVAEPFPHLAVDSGLLHWLAMGLSYALAAVGYFLLLELFVQVSYDTKPFAVLVSVTGLPVLLDVVGFASPTLIDITYEPLGVAVFAVGVFYLYVDRFQAIQVAGERDDPVVVLNAAGRIRDYNGGAASLFPGLETRSAIGEPLEEVLPDLAETLRSETSVLCLERGEVTQYYRVSETSFGTNHSPLGRLIVLTDITHREQYRRELERQNERLDQFASMVSHDLRNPLNVAVGQLELAREETDSERLDAVADAHDRMAELIEDVLTLARLGQPIDDTETVRLAAVAKRCWRIVESSGTDLVVEGDMALEADADRLQQLLENLFRNAVEHGGEGVTIHVGTVADEPGFYVADDGPGIPESDRERVFESGYTTEREGTGFGLSIVREIAEAHGWEVRVSESAEGGARFEITGVREA